MQLGPITLVRKGKVVMMKNQVTPEQHAEFVAKAAADYEPVVKEMKGLGKTIAEKVVRFDPLELLTRAYWKHVKSLHGLESEAEMGPEQNESFALIKFIQTCVASTPPAPTYQECTEEDWAFLEENVRKLYSDSILRYQIANTAHRKSKGLEHEENDELYFQLVTFWVSVHGERYLNHELEHLTDLLSPHSDILQKRFGVTAAQIAHGMHQMMMNLISSPLIFNDFADLRKEVDAAMDEKIKMLEASGAVVDEKKFKELAATMVDELGLRGKADEITGKLFGTDLFDIEKVSGLPPILLDELSLSPGQDKDFFGVGKFPGTPLQRLPVRTHPVLKLNKRYYVFHPHLISDNLYRNIQNAVLKKEPTYSEKWNDRQTEVSERLPFEILSSLLPGASIHRNFQFYGKDRSGSENWIECDGVVLFDNFLFVVEAKGGKRAAKTPAQNIEAHFETIRDLLADPADQGRRFVEHLMQNGAVEIFDKKQRSIATLRKDQFQQMAVVAVSLEQLTDISPKVHQFEKLGLSPNGAPVWVTSIDDLRVYRDILKTPIAFTHFVVERLRSFKNKRLNLHDELDHLGLYLDKNRYHDITDEMDEDVKATWNGFRSELDKYFYYLLAEPSKAVLPNQPIPQELGAILKTLEQERQPGFTWAGHQLLDFDLEGRNCIADSIRSVLELQRTQERVRPFSLAGEQSISFVVKYPGLQIPAEFNSREYALSNMVAQQRSNALLFVLSFDERHELRNVDFEWFSATSLQGAYGDKIRSKAAKLAQARIKAATEVAPRKKIGRNDLCPCGSGKKFKKCHGFG